jgi:hypothetical protein
MAELSGKTAKIRFTSIVGTSSTDNAATISTGGGTGNSSIQINATGRRHWDRSATAEPDLFLNSTLVPSTAFDLVNKVQGIFALNESRSSTGTYTIDCHFLTSTFLTGGQEWSVDVDVDMLETTSFSTSTGNTQWRTFTPGLSEATASIERLVSTGDTGPVFFDRLNLPSDLIIELVTDDAVRFEGYARVSADGWNASVDELTVESVDLQIDGPLYFSTT